MRHIAEGDDDDCRKHLRNGRIDMQVLNKQLNKYVIKKNTKCHEQEIPEQLNPAP